MGPVGIFDSGIGGMSLFLSLRAKVPSLPLIYVADTVHFPYGNKSPKSIVQFSDNICRFFVRTGAQAIICGCNTASSAAVPLLQQQLPIPLFSVIEPAVHHVLSHDGIRKLGIIGTETSIRLGAHEKLIHQKAPEIQVFGQACPGLAPAVELGASKKEKLALVSSYLQPLIANHIDGLLIACTHYTFLIPYIRAILPKTCQLFDTTEACVESFLQNHPLKRTESLQKQTTSKIITTGNVRQFKRTMNSCLKGLPYDSDT